jgi:dienelactone hydrolase
MRPLEILIPVSLGIYVVWPFLTGKENPLLVTLLPILTAMLVGAHLLVEGYRWQMIPLYVLTGIILMTALPEFFHPAAGEFKRLSWAAAGLLLSLALLIVAAALPILLPVPNIAGPRGPFPVGTQTFVLTDDSRPELYSGRDEPRKFMLQVWYPTDPDPDAQRAPWMNDAHIYARELASYLGLPDFLLDHLELVKTPAYLNTRLEPYNSTYPLVIFSHGWSGFAAQNTGQAIELASRGYVVAALQHTYGAVVTVFPDGEIAYINHDALPEGLPEDEYETAARILAEQWAGDISFALDYLENENLDPASQFYSVLDNTSTGVFGHSTGGGAAIQFCGSDSRCKAVLGMDPFMTPVSQQILEQGIAQPAFFMFSQGWADDTDSKNNRLFKQFRASLTQSIHVIGIKGTTHYDFSDLPMLSPVASRLGLKGPLDGERVIEITNTYLIDFFDLTLKGRPTDLFDEPSPFPEVIDLP